MLGAASVAAPVVPVSWIGVSDVSACCNAATPVGSGTTRLTSSGSVIDGYCTKTKSVSGTLFNASAIDTRVVGESRVSESWMLEVADFARP